MATLEIIHEESNYDGRWFIALQPKINAILLGLTKKLDIAPIGEIWCEVNLKCAKFVATTMRVILACTI